VGCILAKTILIVSGGIEAVPGIIRAKTMGYHVVVSDGNPNAPGFEYCDDKIIASTYDISESVKRAKSYNSNTRKIDGVICIAADIPLTVASIADELGLRGLPLKTASLAMDKIQMKDWLSNKNIPIPDYNEIFTLGELTDCIKSWGLPLVLKPVDSRGARGVLLLTNEINFQWAWEHSKENSPTGRVMVEKYLPDPQISTEAIIVNGIGYPIGFSDRNYEYIDRFSPYIIENGGDFPSSLSATDQEAISELAIKAGIVLGIDNGIVKGDMVFTGGEPKVIEIAARLSGGWLSTNQIPAGFGIDLIGAAIKLALGENIDKEELKPKYQKGVAIRYFFPKPGIVTNIKIGDEYRDKSWVHKLGFFISEGDIIEPVSNHTKRAGFVITTAATKELAVKRANAVIRGIEIETIPGN